MDALPYLFSGAAIFTAGSFALFAVLGFIGIAAMKHAHQGLLIAGYVFALLLLAVGWWQAAKSEKNSVEAEVVSPAKDARDTYDPYSDAYLKTYPYLQGMPMSVSPGRFLLVDRYRVGVGSYRIEMLAANGEILETLRLTKVGNAVNQEIDVYRVPGNILVKHLGADEK